MPVEIPDNFFEPPKQRPENWPDNPPLRNAVDWLKGYINSAEWRARRVAATNRLYNTALGEVEEADKGHFFAEADMFGWYLFLAEAFLDHMWNYEPMYGSRVVPVLTAIGRNLDALQNIAGIDDRVARLVGAERRQPNGGLFELLVASAYCRAGGVVRFLAERPGVERTHDLDVVLSGKTFAVECKRMETT